MNVHDLKLGNALQIKIAQVSELIKNLQELNAASLYKLIARNNYHADEDSYEHESAATAVKDIYGAFLKNELQRLQTEFDEL